MKKILAYGVLILSALLIFAGCSTQSGSGGSASGSKKSNKGKITLRFAWWGDQARDKRTEKVIKLYEKLHPNVKIVPEFTGDTSAYFNKLDTEFAAGNAPDIIQYGGNLNDYVNKGVVLPLNAYEGKELDISKHPKSMIQAATWNNKLYGVCLGVNAFGVLIDKTLFKKANVPLPGKKWTWNDLQQTGIKLSKALKGTAYGLRAFDENGFSMYLAQEGKDIYKNGKLGFSEKDIQNWFQMWQNMRKSGAAAPAGVQAQDTSGTDPARSLIAQGKVAIELIATNLYPAYASATHDQLALQIFPYGKSGKNGVPLRPSQFLAGNAKTKYPKEVAKFLNFMVNNKKAGTILGMDRGIPVNPNVRKQVTTSANKTEKVVLNYVDWVSNSSKAPYEPNLPGYTEEQKLFQKTAQNIAFNKESVKKASEDYYTQLKTIVKENQ